MSQNKILTLGEIGQLPNKFLSPSFMDADVFNAVDASRFYYDYCYRPYNTFDIDAILTSANDNSFIGTLSEFQTKLNTYKTKGYELALINFGFFNKIYQPNFYGDIKNDEESKLTPHVLNYVDMEKVWYVNYYHSMNGGGTADPYEAIESLLGESTTSHYVLIIYDIQNNKPYGWFDARNYENIMSLPCDWDGDKTYTNFNVINSIIKRIIWAYKDTSTINKNFCPAVNSHIPFSDWDAVLEAGKKNYTFWGDLPCSNGLLSFDINLETTANTKCVRSTDLNWYDNLIIIREPQGYLGEYGWSEWDSSLQNITLEWSLEVITSESTIKTTTKKYNYAYDSTKYADYGYSVLANKNDINKIIFSYILTFDSCSYNEIPLFIDTIDCEFSLNAYNDVLGNDSIVISRDEGILDTISITGDFAFTTQSEIEEFILPHEFIAEITINENDYAWFGCIYQPTTNSNCNYRIELGKINDPDSAFCLFTTPISTEELPKVEWHEVTYSNDHNDMPFYGISKSDIDGYILAVKFFDEEYGSEGIALFDFTYDEPIVGKKYTVETDSDGFVISNDIKLYNYVDSTAPKEMQVGMNSLIMETISSSNKYYGIIGCNTSYSFYEGQNTPPSYDYDTGLDVTYDLQCTVLWEDYWSYKYFNWAPGDYGDFSLGPIAAKYLIIMENSYYENSASIEIAYA